MIIKDINYSSKDLQEVKEIYLDSFPSSERIDFIDLINKKFPNSKILGIFVDDKLIGFSFISIYFNYVYIVYLAIKSSQRNKSFGSKALELIKQNYKNKTLILCVEKPCQQETLKLRRINFYKRNGFNLANFEFECLNEMYYTMYCGKFNKKNL